MKKYLYLLLAFVLTSAVMTLFEFINSFIFPFPEFLDRNNLEAVRAFTVTMPDTALIMILLGWFFGTILGTYTVLKFTKSTKLIYIHAGVLTILAVINNYLFMGTDRLWFSVLTLPFFFVVAWGTKKYIFDRQNKV